MSSHACGISLPIVAIALAATVTTACSGDEDGNSGYSGVDSTKYLDELSETERLRLCSWAIPREGGAGTYTCSDGTTGTIYTTEQCAASPVTTTAHCLVSLVEACVLSLDGDPCQMRTSAACVSYMQCATVGTT
jgi:hypothetical protein